MSEWKSAQFKEYFAIGLRNGLTKPSKVRGAGIRMINMKEIFGHDFIADNTHMESVPVTDNELASSSLEFDDLLFARQSLVESGAGKIAIFKGQQPTVFESHLIRCRIAKDKACPAFIYYLFKSPIGLGTVSTIVQQVAAAGIRGTDLQNLEFRFPSLDEQKAIADVFSSLDNKIDLLHRQNQTLESLAATLFRRWFMEEAQEGWGAVTLGDVISVKGGTTPSTKEPEYWDGTIHWATPRDLSNHNSVFLFDTERKITDKGLAKIGSGLIPVGTVLLSSRAPIGYLAIADIPVAINQGYIAIVCDKLVSNYFIYLWCKANMDTIKNAGNGSTFEEISKSNFKALEVILPPKEKLKEFDDVVLPSFEKIRTNKKQIRTLEKLRDTLLPKLMSGDVRVTYEGMTS
ncbi:MAG: restriction endonuclease subunit S [Burkholderiales bacterium]